jgi:hypothetical protein
MGRNLLIGAGSFHSVSVCPSHLRSRTRAKANGPSGINPDGPSRRIVLPLERSLRFGALPVRVCGARRLIVDTGSNTILSRDLRVECRSPPSR